MYYVCNLNSVYLVKDGPWNNYGIDCDIVQKYIKVSNLFNFPSSFRNY